MLSFMTRILRANSLCSRYTAKWKQHGTDGAFRIIVFMLMFDENRHMVTPLSRNLQIESSEACFYSCLESRSHTFGQVNGESVRTQHHRQLRLSGSASDGLVKRLHRRAAFAQYISKRSRTAS